MFAGKWRRMRFMWGMVVRFRRVDEHSAKAAVCFELDDAVSEDGNASSAIAANDWNNCSVLAAAIVAFIRIAVLVHS